MGQVKTIYMEFMETEYGIKGVASDVPRVDRSPEDETIEIVGQHALMVMQDLEIKVKQRWGDRIHTIQNVLSAS